MRYHWNAEIKLLIETKLDEIGQVFVPLDGGGVIVMTFVLLSCEKEPGSW